jgi:hypothetical protein
MYSEHANFEWHLDRMAECGIGWVKFLSDGSSSGLQFSQEVLNRGMIPVVRFYCHPTHRWTDANSMMVDKLVALGVRYISTINEPDLKEEWNDKHVPDDWVAISFSNWTHHAREILDRGGIPLTPALASGVLQARGQGAGQLTVNCPAP